MDRLVLLLSRLQSLLDFEALVQRLSRELVQPSLVHQRLLLAELMPHQRYQEPIIAFYTQGHNQARIQEYRLFVLSVSQSRIPESNIAPAAKVIAKDHGQLDSMVEVTKTWALLPFSQSMLMAIFVLMVSLVAMVLMVNLPAELPQLLVKEEAQLADMDYKLAYPIDQLDMSITAVCHIVLSQ